MRNRKRGSARCRDSSPRVGKDLSIAYGAHDASSASSSARNAASSSFLSNCRDCTIVKQIKNLCCVNSEPPQLAEQSNLYPLKFFVLTTHDETMICCRNRVTLHFSGLLFLVSANTWKNHRRVYSRTRIKEKLKSSQQRQHQLTQGGIFLQQ